MYGDDILAQELGDPTMRYELLFWDSEPIGYASYRFELPNVFLSKLYLNPDLHGKGLGRAALMHLEDAARERGATSIYLFVNKRNEKSHSRLFAVWIHD